MEDKYNYGGHVALVKKAAGVAGVLIKDAAGNYLFRVYGKEDGFTDYEILDNDLSVTIAEDELAAFYQFNDRLVLDHSPQVLGLEKAIK